MLAVYQQYEAAFSPGGLGRVRREPGVKTLGLHTTKAMLVARWMYERMGFVRAR